MLEYEIPLVIRGEVYRDNLVDFPGRHGKIVFKTPDVNHYFDKIVMRNPSEMRDLYTITFNDILDYLDELGQRLDPKRNEHIRKAIEISAATSGHSLEMLNYMYAAMPHALRRDFVKEAVDQMIGIDHIEGWVRRELHDRTIDVRAMGARGVHINAGNGAVISLQGILMNSVLRSDAIMKSPSNDPYTGVAMALTMIEMAPKHPLTRHMTVAYWKGGDEKFEKRLYNPNHLEKIIAWGGFASMQHIRGNLGPGLDLIALDPKLSMSIIGREAFDSTDSMRLVAQQLAKDIGLFNQEGCIASRVTYVESGTDEAGIEKLNLLGEMVFKEMLDLPTALSSQHPAFDPVLREEMRSLRFSDDFKIYGGQGDEGGIIVSQLNEPVDFADRLGCRVGNLVPVDRIAEAVSHVTIHVSTIGVYPDQLKEEIREECALRGAQRLTSLGYAPNEGAAQPHDAIEQMRRMARWIVVENFDRTKGDKVGWVHGG